LKKRGAMLFLLPAKKKSLADLATALVATDAQGS
jgi:hypothetical protein